MVKQVGLGQQLPDGILFQTPDNRQSNSFSRLTWSTIPKNYQGKFIGASGI